MTEAGEPLRVLTGPTASGKTAAALAIAERIGGEIVSMDSMAIYRRMDIGTAKPTPAERARVPHHLLDLVEPNESFDVQRWCALAEAAVDEIRRRGKQPLLVGGTPLYLVAFCKGMMRAPSADPELRAMLEARELHAPGTLHRELQRLDPAAAERIHVRDRKRLVRALEVAALTGQPISAQQTQFDAAGWRRPVRIVALDVPRTELHARVKQRTIAMLDSGLLDEVRAIRDSCGFSREAAAAIGYAECLTYLDGRCKDFEELRNRIRRSTHRLIRRQITWLRRLREIAWIAPEAGIDAAVAGLEG